MDDVATRLKLFIADHAEDLSDECLNLLKSAILEINQLRAVAGKAIGTDDLSLAAIRRDIDHG